MGPEAVWPLTTHQLPAALDRRGHRRLLHRPRRQRAGARLRLLEDRGSRDGGPLVTDVDPAALRKKEINGPIRLPKRDFFTRGQKLKVKDPWHILSGYDLEFAGMSTRERVRVMLEWFGRRQTIALPINSVVGCLIATILLMILSETNVRAPFALAGSRK